MPLPLVECVPNFSEARRPEVVAAIVEALTSAAPIQLLDTSSDLDHNRTVVTFVGEPQAVALAAFAGIKAAAERIDLNLHKGQHPRIGATDVVPFIPIRDVTMAECVALARQVGERVGRELNIPVYLYEAAATRPDRENLENIRRGEYEGLRDAIAVDPDRAPDFGPAALGTAGATVIGARPPLIAFNVYLTTTDVRIAKEIAKAVRHSSGGLRYVKALGLLVEGKAQVSMNLTNYEKTPIFRVVELIRREAARYGVGISHTELVGLIPEIALIDSAQWYLQLDKFEPRQVLERRLQEVGQSPASAPITGEESFGVPIPTSLPESDGLPAAPSGLRSPYARPEPTPEQQLTAFVESVAANTPTPGGGAVSALVASLAAALGEMAARLTIGKKKYADLETQMTVLANHAVAYRRRLLELVSADSRAFNAVMAAYKLDANAPNREATIQTALRGAAEVPLDVMRHAVEALKLIRTVAERGNVNAATDAAVGAHMAAAACEGAALNVRINIQLMTDRALAAALTNQMAALLTEARGLSADIIVIAETRAKLR